jgi:preprotein translocase subunit SecE
LARVPVSNTGGWGFKSLLPCKKFYRRFKQVVEDHLTEEKLGFFGRINLFYRQVVAELRKVVWPTRKQLTTYTAVVLVFVGFIIAVVSALDVVVTKVVFWVFG